MGKDCDCSTVSNKVREKKQLDYAVVTRGVLLSVFILALCQNIPMLETYVPSLASFSHVVPPVSYLLICLVAVITFRSALVGTCCLPSAQVTASELKSIIAARNADDESRIMAASSDMAKRLGRGIQFQTISFDKYDTLNKTDYTQFDGMREYIEKEYPLFHEKLEQTIINKYSLLYKWEGSDPSQKPYLLTAHMDVVPVPDPELWKADPFGGEIRDGCVWGRGAIDDKQNVFGYLEAVTDLLKKGFSPRRTVYIAFGHDEEISGVDGARHVGEHLLATLGPDCMEFMMDEGLFIMDGTVPGHKKPVAMVCIAEKGAVTIKLTVDIVGGHASAPSAHTAIGILAKAVQRVENSPMPAHADPALNIFDTLRTGFSLPYRIIMSNLWLFSPLLKFILTLKPLTAVLVRTTTALTLFSAGTKHNVLPSKATAYVNHRIHPSDSVASVIAWDKAVINDDRVQLEAVDETDPAPVSDANHPAFKDITTSIHRTYKGTCSVAPSLFVANSDSRHYWNVSPQIFRFNPITLHESELNMFHGVNERIRVDDYAQLVYFYRNLIEITDARSVLKDQPKGQPETNKKHD